MNKVRTQPTTQHHLRILNIDITEKAAAYGVTVFDIFRLVLALQVEYFAYKSPMPEPHAVDKNSPLTIAAIFNTPKPVAKICICLHDELEHGRITSCGPELLYPRKAPIATAIHLPTLIKATYRESNTPNSRIRP